MWRNTPFKTLTTLWFVFGFTACTPARPYVLRLPSASNHRWWENSVETIITARHTTTMQQHKLTKYKPRDSYTQSSWLFFAIALELAAASKESWPAKFAPIFYRTLKHCTVGLVNWAIKKGVVKWFYTAMKNVDKTNTVYFLPFNKDFFLHHKV